MLRFCHGSFHQDVCGFIFAHQNKRDYHFLQTDSDEKITKYRWVRKHLKEKHLHWLSKQNKQTDLKGRLSLCWVTLFTCGGPCHLSSFKQCSGTLFSSESSWFILWWNKYTCLSLCCDKWRLAVDTSDDVCVWSTSRGSTRLQFVVVLLPLCREPIKMFHYQADNLSDIHRGSPIISSLIL